MEAAKLGRRCHRPGRPYTEARHHYTHTLQIDRDDCYTLEFTDKGKDGIAGAAGNGYYQLFQITADGKKTNVSQGYYEGEYYDLHFSMQEANGTLGISDATSHAGNTATAYDMNGNIIAKGSADSIGKAIGGKGARGIIIIKDAQGKAKKAIAK